MSLCSLNISLGIIQAGFLKIEPKRISGGPCGKFYDDFLVFKKRMCHFLPVVGFSKEDLGKNDGNLSAVSMLQSNRLDLYTIPADLALVPHDHKFIETTKAAQVNPYLVGQFLKPEESDTSADLTSFLFQNKHMLAVLLSGYILITTLALGLSPMTRSGSGFFRSLLLVVRRVLYGSGRPLPSFHKVALLLLFFNLFLFINQTLLRSSIKTEKATVNTNEIIDSLSKLIATPKTMVVNFEEESILKLALEHSFLGRLAKKRRIVYKAPMSEEKIQEMKKERMESLFFFSSEVYLYFVFSTFASTAKQTGLVAFIRSQIYSESFVRVFHLRRGLTDEKKRFIHNSIERSFESGLISIWFLRTNEASLQQVMKNTRLYRSTEEYIDNRSQNSLHTKVNFENLSTAFASFFLVLACILVGFAIAWCLPGIGRRLEILRLNARFLVIEQSQLIRLRFFRLRSSFMAKPRNARNSVSSAPSEAGQCESMANDQRSSSV